jgi:hypothetical protein
MSEHHEGPDSLESMAFQLLLQKVAGLERAMASLTAQAVPLFTWRY